ncbi:alpha/beta hydrolase [Nonomuraea sp. K274]|uniref:Alpha/beta hydrolase n=1 Tax=Nonomuraea cypriaca TaxID=1187855 RepID=A0A931A3X3_9ACTN|nr:alpha/beta hydrolase [Nonomuraea cypriaca]MBF8185786.1 alpha/beta hydrolase [Nonomuraea cypriaca]
MASGRRRKVSIALAALAAVLVCASGYAAWWGSDQSIKVVRYGENNTRVLAVRGHAVTLTDTAETRKPGTYWLEWTGSHSMLGEIVSRAPGQVTREVLRGFIPSVGTPGRFGNVPPGDPKVAWGVDYSEIMIPTELGPAPAWYVPGRGSTWVIAVHGQNGRRKAELKVLPVVHQLGLPFLNISYRNDEGAPPSPDGLIHLGDSEWRDLEAAVREAQRRGARRVILYGTSMGGAIVGRFLARSPLATMVDRAILDAPMIDVGMTAAHSASGYGVPAFFGSLSNHVTEWRTGVDVDGLSMINHPPKVRPPLLLIHTVPDEAHPVQESRLLAATGRRLNWPIQLEEFARGQHTEAWNVDRARYDRLLRDFLDDARASPE